MEQEMTNIKLRNQSKGEKLQIFSIFAVFSFDKRCNFDDFPCTNCKLFIFWQFFFFFYVIFFMKYHDFELKFD